MCGDDDNRCPALVMTRAASEERTLREARCGQNGQAQRSFGLLPLVRKCQAHREAEWQPTLGDGGAYESADSISG